MDLDHLNRSQREAVLTTEGPLLVLAGAGSGKTRVITHRVAYLLDQGIEPESIVAITFTNKASEEMRSRLRKMVGKKIANVLVMGTFHSLGARMIREQPQDFGMPKRFSILDQGDVYGSIRSLLREVGFHGKANDRRFDPGAIAQRISLWKNDFLSYEQAHAYSQGPSASEYDEIAAAVFEAYEDRLSSMGAVDFDDLVCKISNGLLHNLDAKERWSQRFRYILVDEYQDTNRAQMQMLQGLLNDQQNLCVVGDDDQAIYGWRGARVENILAFDKKFPSAKVIKLEINYRSMPPIITSSNHLVAHNSNRYDKSLIPHRKDGDPVTLVACSDEQEEDKWVGRRIYALIHESNVAPGSIAVLYRSSRQAKGIEGCLQEHGIVHQILGGQNVFDRKEVRDVLAYLKVLLTPYDDLAVRRALEVPARGIGRKSMELLHAFATSNHLRLVDAIDRAREITEISDRARKGITGFTAVIHKASASLRSNGSVAKTIRTLLQDIHLREHIAKDTGSGKATQARWSNVEWLIDAVERFENRLESGKAKKTWKDFFATVERRDDDPEQEANQDAVTLATMHSAKGLEWRHVFIIGCEEGITPHRRVDAPRISDAVSGDIEEERRLFYVAMTRAKDQLWLTRALSRSDRGRTVECKPSRFLAELPPDELRIYDVSQEEQLSGDRLQNLADAFLAKLALPDSA